MTCFISPPLAAAALCRLRKRSKTSYIIARISRLLWTTVSARTCVALLNLATHKAQVGAAGFLEDVRPVRMGGPRVVSRHSRSAYGPWKAVIPGIPCSQLELCA